MEYSAKEIADMLGGKVEGDGSVMISKFARIEYGEPGAISFLANPNMSNTYIQARLRL